RVRVEYNVSEVIGPDVPKTVPKESRLHLMLPIQINKLGASFLRTDYATPEIHNGCKSHYVPVQ
ncbi:MAG: hypothetical protein LBQ20_09120, partial [Rhodanobacter sp.]|nr:hypothetical protein [Rhodanobacter sp.]